MPTTGRRRRLAAALLVVCLFSTSALAQEPTAPAPSLRLPTFAASAAATADWISTYHALSHFQVRESNPLLKRWNNSPGQLIGIGGLIDVGGLAAWNLGMGPRHPKLAVTGLWVMTAFRSYLAVHNLRNEQRAAPR